jgi:hypothetical protein
MALKDTARELGAVPKLMGAIRRFEDNAEVMEAGCSGIQALCSNCKTNKKEVAEHGGITLVLSGMRRFAEDSRMMKVQLEAVADPVRGNANTHTHTHTHTHTRARALLLG